MNELSQKELQLVKSQTALESLIEKYKIEFRYIKDYEDYAISEYGDIWSFKSNMFLKTWLNHRGYVVCILSRNGKKKNVRINRLVAEAFIPNPENLPQVGHDDDVKENNHYSNLYWTTNKENATHNGKHLKLCKTIKCVENDKIFSSVGEAAAYANVKICTISNCLAGRSKSAGGLHWEYVKI